MALVYILNATPAGQACLAAGVRAADARAVLCADIYDYLAQPRGQAPSCLVADEAMIGAYAPNLGRLCSVRPETPLICTAPQPTLRSVVLAVRTGALDFLPEPFEVQLLLDAIQTALDKSQRIIQRNADLDRLSARYEKLSPRERQVMSSVIAGRLNKQIAHELGLSLITVKTHRGRVMRKMRASSLPELVTMAARLSNAGNLGDTRCENQSMAPDESWFSWPRSPQLSVRSTESRVQRLRSSAC